MEDAERQRHERRLARDRRRKEQGKPTYFESDATLESWPLTQDPAERSTAILRPSRDRDELIELEAQALDQEGQAGQAGAFAPPVVSDEPRPEAEEATGRGLARSGVIFAIDSSTSFVTGVAARSA